MAKKVNNSMLHHGTAMPYLALFDSEGNPVKNTLTGIPLGAYITSFNYRYDEAKENEFNIALSGGNPDMVDMEILADGRTILLQWGYVYADGTSVSGPIKAMMIKNVDATFNDSGVNLKIKGVDGTYNFRLVPPFIKDISGSSENTLSRYIDNGMGGNVGVIIEKY